MANQHTVLEIPARSRPEDIDIIDALQQLGDMWGINRSLTYTEMAGVLGIEGADPGRTVRRWADGTCETPGPALVALHMMLRGGMPPGVIVLGPRGHEPKLVVERRKRLARAQVGV